MAHSDLEFISRICLLFNLGDPRSAVMNPLSGNANRLWRLATNEGTFVVKEFRYTIEDIRWVAAICKAAEFEFEVWRTGIVPMPQPLRGKDGAIVSVIIGSRGQQVAVRLHPWLDGVPILKPVSVQTAVSAGALLSDIHGIGQSFANSNQQTLRWWRWDPEGSLLRLQKLGLFDAKTTKAARAALLEAERLITDGEATPGIWVFSHYDHKPENTLFTGEVLTVLDWDESALCHPRLEAVESALRWAGIAEGKPHADTFAAFIEGYRSRGVQLGKLNPSDFAKLVASTVGWFEYLVRRALREFDDNETEAMAAAQSAVAVIESLGPMLTEVHRWSLWGL